MVFSSPRRRCDCVRSAWPVWFASHGAAPGSLALVATAGRGPLSGLVLVVVSRVRDGPRVRSHVSFPPSPRYGSARPAHLVPHGAALDPWRWLQRRAIYPPRGALAGTRCWPRPHYPGPFAA
ncbi:hypothetical protein V6N11_055811 [Hibiscus sabdariffa]|uniref:Uncharacterized protein n=2 Tax=Hibiscus sabdariffa TaxID=183260 RepID=A0ABR1ZR53_9ROSI